MSGVLRQSKAGATTRGPSGRFCRRAAGLATRSLRSGGTRERCRCCCVWGKRGRADARSGNFPSRSAWRGCKRIAPGVETLAALVLLSPGLTRHQTWRTSHQHPSGPSPRPTSCSLLPLRPFPLSLRSAVSGSRPNGQADVSSPRNSPFAWETKTIGKRTVRCYRNLPPSLAQLWKTAAEVRAPAPLPRARFRPETDSDAPGRHSPRTSTLYTSKSG